MVLSKMLVAKVVLYNFFLSFSVISFRIAQESVGNAEPSSQFLMRFVLSPWILFGLFLAFFTRVLNYAVITEVGVNQSMIVLSSAYAFVYALSWLLLGELVTLKQVMGTLVIMLGIGITAYE